MKFPFTHYNKAFETIIHVCSFQNPMYSEVSGLGFSYFDSLLRSNLL